MWRPINVPVRQGHILALAVLQMFWGCASPSSGVRSGTNANRAANTNSGDRSNRSNANTGNVNAANTLNGNVPAGFAFSLTPDADTVTGTSGSDSFEAGAGSLNATDRIVGGGGNDTLDAAIEGDSSSGAALIDLGIVNFTVLGDATFDASNSTGIGSFVVSGAGNLTLNNVTPGPTFGMRLGYDQTLTVNLSTTPASATLNLEVAGSGAAFAIRTPNAGVVETLNIHVAGGSSLADPGSGTLFGDVAHVILSGSADFVLRDLAPASIGPPTIDASGLSEQFIISTNGGRAFDFAAAGVVGIDHVGFGDATTPLATGLIFDEANGPVEIVIHYLHADQKFGILVVGFAGSGTNDTVTLELLSGNGIGHIDASTIETLNIVSGSDSDGTETDPDMGISLRVANGITMSASAAVETINVSGDTDLALGTLTNVDRLDASDFTGDLHVAAGDGGVIMIGGAGDDLISGGAGADQLNGGPGDDDLDGQSGADVLIGSTGRDRFVFLAFGPDEGIDILSGGDFTAGSQGDQLLVYLPGPPGHAISSLTRSTINESAASVGSGSIFLFTDDAVGTVSALMTRLNDSGFDTVNTSGSLLALWKIDPLTVGLALISNNDTLDNNDVSVTEFARITGFAGQAAMNAFIEGLSTENFNLVQDAGGP